MRTAYKIIGFFLAGSFLVLGSLGPNWNDLVVCHDLTPEVSEHEAQAVVTVKVRHRHGDEQHWHTHRQHRSKTEVATAPTELTEQELERSRIVGGALFHQPHLCLALLGFYQFGLGPKCSICLLKLDSTNQRYVAIDPQLDRLLPGSVFLGRGPPALPFNA